MKIRQWLGIFLFIGLFQSPAFALEEERDLEVFLAGRFMAFGDGVFGRETIVQYAVDPKLTLRLRNDSYDDLFYGGINRWGFHAATSLVDGDFGLDAGGGLGLSSSYAASAQLSLDLVLALSYGILRLDLEHMWFRDGLLGDYFFGVHWKVYSGAPDVKLILGVSALLNTNFRGISFYPGLTAGVAVAF